MDTGNVPREPDGTRPNRKGVVAVIRQDNLFLTIRRSAFVTAPLRLCFPGGGIEEGETARDALLRELHEELGVRATAREALWTSHTPWGTHLFWWTAQLPDPFTLIPNAAEVAEVMWMTADELMRRTDVLASVPQFIQAFQAGEFELN